MLFLETHLPTTLFIMDVKEIKLTVSNLEKLSDDTTILKLLNILNDGIEPTEKLLRETKVGVAVNKYRSNSNSEISTLVKRMIKKWKEVVQNEKNAKKAQASAAPAPAKPAPGSTGGKFHNGPRNPKTDGVDTTIYDDSTRNASVSALYTALAIERDDDSKTIVNVAVKIESEVYAEEYSKVNDGYRNKLRTLTMNLRNKKNPDLRANLLTGSLKPEKFIKMSPNEMALRP